MSLREDNPLVSVWRTVRARLGAGDSRLSDWVAAILPLGLAVFLGLLPLLTLLYESVAPGSAGMLVSFEAYERALDPLYLRILGWSFVVATVVTVLCLLLGHPLTYWLANHCRRWLRLPLLLLLLPPPWLHYLVLEYPWVWVLAR